VQGRCLAFAPCLPLPALLFPAVHGARRAGMMSQYGEDWGQGMSRALPERLLWKSAALTGFFLLHYTRHFRRHLATLVRLVDAGEVRVALDSERFLGIESVARAIDWLQSGRSMGKVCVQLAQLPEGLLHQAPAARL
jgi:NADPH-dependent curcumin reductase CurA